MKMEENFCKSCNKEIPNKKVYCDAVCMTNNYRINKVEIECEVCGTKKLKSKSQSEYKYCSKSCYNESRRGVKRPKHSLLMKGKKLRIGRKLTNEQRKKMRGSNSPHWKGGTSPLNTLIRRLVEYSDWRFSVYKRDNFKCQVCFIENKRLECHHIKSFAVILKEFKITNLEEAINCEQLWDVSNGQTLCKECHKKTDSYGNKVNKL
jgi:hypothetical protein